jgi:hypothetical protein
MLTMVSNFPAQLQRSKANSITLVRTSDARLMKSSGRIEAAVYAVEASTEM